MRTLWRWFTYPLYGACVGFAVGVGVAVSETLQHKGRPA